VAQPSKGQMKLLEDRRVHRLVGAAPERSPRRSLAAVIGGAALPAATLVWGLNLLILALDSPLGRVANVHDMVGPRWAVRQCRRSRAPYFQRKSQT
jgi:hypothetical protein